MAAQRFTSAIKVRGINPYILISAARASAMKPQWRKPMPVLMRINGKPAQPWRINMMPAGNGSFYLYLHGDVRRASNTTVGDRVRVEVDFDSKYESGATQRMPSWFKAALLKRSKTMKNWDALIPSRKKEILRYLSQLKSPEARARHVTRALTALSGKPEQFMARSWNKKSHDPSRDRRRG